ncbi:dihydrodipicolinate synthase family protein [Nocardioides flavescens]|uniref:Dihydrodipicolinate synthase family protein n=1 Tax=Nocardioides flavescens TaxID=2691959 RepID=A0A6L7EZS6_9ACTN|nr:dihydrodipicolinate synthase family protein [Nocardioides flavescens]MXG91338.1 dihydrodipicolinate synthase family protein [Nocardioides flavescens]
MTDAPQFEGSYTVAVTPFTDDASAVDTDRLKAFLDWQLETGVLGIIMLGTTGEFITLSREERRTVVETTVQHIDGRIPVLIGTMNASTAIAVEQSVEAAEAGADGLMILPPYYYTPTDDEIYRYYEAITDAVSVPIMLYNNPVTSNVDMSAALVARLAKAFPNVSYIKESSQSIPRVGEVLELAGDDIVVYAGEQLVDSYALGARGYVNPYGNYIPRASAGMYRLLSEGRVDEARHIDSLIHTFDAIIAEGHPTYGHQCYSKELARRAGYPVGPVRAPLTTFAQLGAEGEEKIERILKVTAEIDDYAVQIGL